MILTTSLPEWTTPGARHKGRGRWNKLFFQNSWFLSPEPWRLSSMIIADREWGASQGDQYHFGNPLDPPWAPPSWKRESRDHLVIQLEIPSFSIESCDIMMKCHNAKYILFLSNLLISWKHIHIICMYITQIDSDERKELKQDNKHNTVRFTPGTPQQTILFPVLRET